MFRWSFLEYLGKIRNLLCNNDKKMLFSKVAKMIRKKHYFSLSDTVFDEKLWLACLFTNKAARAVKRILKNQLFTFELNSGFDPIGNKSDKFFNFSSYYSTYR